jgi:hypothetical protein
VAFIPLSLWFHPVYLAAAYLAWAKDDILTKTKSLKPALPDYI